MRTIYLIRHGAPELPDEKKRCYSRTDFPLSRTGLAQGKALREWAAAQSICAIYTSPSTRCRETAWLMSGGTLPVVSVDALQETCVGDWEGYTFEEIRKRWPDIYAARGRLMYQTAPPGGESFHAAAERFDAALRDILSASTGDIAIVSHSGILRSWLLRYAGLGGGDMFSIPMPCAGITTLRMEGNTLLHATAGVRAAQAPPAESILDYYRRCSTPDTVIAHCRAVADKAQALAAANQVCCDRALLRAACLLHDMCRADGRAHPANAAHILTMDGYPALAHIILGHHDLICPAPVEMELLYLSDKLIAGTQAVTLEKRFSESRKKCTDDDAVHCWERRLCDAKKIVKKYRLEGQI